MTLKLDIRKEIEASLLAQAQARGMSLETYAQRVLESAARKDEAVVQKRPASRKSLAQLFAESPFKGTNLNFERDSDTGRNFGL